MVTIEQESRRGVLVERAEADNVPVIKLIKDAIAQAGSIHGAALRLGVNPNTVRYHLKKAGLAVKSLVTIELEETREAL